MHKHIVILEKCAFIFFCAVIIFVWAAGIFSNVNQSLAEHGEILILPVVGTALLAGVLFSIVVWFICILRRVVRAKL